MRHAFRPTAWSVPVRGWLPPSLLCRTFCTYDWATTTRLSIRAFSSLILEGELLKCWSVDADEADQHFSLAQGSLPLLYPLAALHRSVHRLALISLYFLFSDMMTDMTYVTTMK